jgi:hypothetical protein
MTPPVSGETYTTRAGERFTYMRPAEAGAHWVRWASDALAVSRWGTADALPCTQVSAREWARMQPIGGRA